MNAKTLSRILLAVFIVVGLGAGGYSLSHAPVSATAWALALLWAVLQALVTWLLVRNHPGRPSNRAFVWLGLLAGMAGGIALPTNNAITHTQSAFSWPSAVTGLLTPTAEETAKALAVLLVAVAFLEIRRPIEATTLGIAAGTGFSIMENITYIALSALQSLTSDANGALIGYLARLMACPFAHSMYTGIAAWGIGCFLGRPDKSLGWRVWRLVGWFALAYAFHGVYNAAPEIFTGEEAGIYILVATIATQWVLAIWLYLRSRKIGKRTAPVDATPEAARA